MRQAEDPSAATGPQPIGVARATEDREAGAVRKPVRPVSPNIGSPSYCPRKAVFGVPPNSVESVSHPVSAPHLTLGSGQTGQLLRLPANAA